MGDKLKNRVAIVTGSGQGIGRAIAVALAGEGAKVVTNNRKPGTSGGDAETTAREIRGRGSQALPFFGDVSNFETARQLVQAAVDNFGRLDILINNAALVATNKLWDITEEEWDQIVNSSLKGSFNCIRHACSLMIEQRWGRIINTTSRVWLVATERAHYAAAKAGIVGLTRAVARDVGSHRVTCNAYAPAAATRINADAETRALFKRRYEAGLYTREEYEARMNLPSPETETPMVVYLCTEEAADINGQVFDVRSDSISIYSEPVMEKTITKGKDLWTIDELIELVPKVLLEGYANPAPPQQASG